MTLGRRFEWAVVFSAVEDEKSELADALSRLVAGITLLYETNGLVVQHSALRKTQKGSHTSSIRHILLITSTSSEMDALAERLEVQKLKLDVRSGEKLNEIFLRSDASSFEGYGKPGFYSPSEREHFVRVLLEGVLSNSSLTQRLLSASGIQNFYKDILKLHHEDSLLGLLTSVGVV